MRNIADVATAVAAGDPVEEESQVKMSAARYLLLKQTKSNTMVDQLNAFAAEVDAALRARSAPEGRTWRSGRCARRRRYGGKT